MSIARKDASQFHRNKAREAYDAAIQELSDANENYRNAEQRRRDAQANHARMDELVKSSEVMHRHFYPEPVVTEDEEATPA